MIFRFPAFILALVATACSAPIVPPAAPPAKPVVVARPPVNIAPKLSGNWLDWPLAPGDWVYRRDERGSIALFGVPGRDALVTLRCDVARKRVYLARADVAATGSATFSVRSSSARKEFSAQTTGGALPYLATEIMPSDTILDAIIYTRGRFALEATGQSPLAIPSWSEIAKIVEDCRT